jgi:hypothetical protein
MREPLPQRRACDTHLIRDRKDQTFSLTVGRYTDGRIGEVFISATNRVGTDLDLVARDAAVLISIALQWGIPLHSMRDAITREADGAPATVIGSAIDKLNQEK